MKTVPMCFSIFEPRCRIHTLASFWWESFHSLDRTYSSSSRFRLFNSKANALEGGYSRRWIRRPVSTQTERKNQTTRNSKPTTIKHEILDEIVSSGATLGIAKAEISKFQICDIEKRIAENQDLAKLVTVVVFDIETTGFSREHERIIEIALQDLDGGANSTFQTLVNPGRHINNSHIHKITTNMVCRPSVPRMEELIPIFLQYIKSRQKPDGYMLFVAHNARSFDVPFLVNEFARCSVDIPPNWLFVDTLPLARELLKSEGSKASQGTSLKDLRQKYDIPELGSAHRAMSDVRVLSLILQRLTIDLKLPLSGLVRKHFKASDLSCAKKNSQQ
ncbi:hypothetical protein Tsubulata_027897 [Turnera subulata]|uniref:Exonuclease domain-containing protein n=1 Tax=Turnera subulata TaxID=218843 RepID=A0A9Q0FX26_9ROSI|nr:hypothetical protein Tsubulata_027897 [Turnera subulata]